MKLYSYKKFIYNLHLPKNCKEQTEFLNELMFNRCQSKALTVLNKIKNTIKEDSVMNDLLASCLNTKDACERTFFTQSLCNEKISIGSMVS